MNLNLETDRLYLRPFEEKDAPFLYELNSDHEVMQYTGDVPFKNLEAARLFATTYTTDSQSQFVLYKMGRLAVIRKEDDAFLGWSGIKFHENQNFVDIGYRFMKKYWGNSYATESGREIVRHAFEDHKIDKLVAQVHEMNIGSQIVAVKLGMNLKHRFLWEEREPGRHYEMVHSSFLKL